MIISGLNWPTLISRYNPIQPFDLKIDLKNWFFEHNVECQYWFIIQNNLGRWGVEGFGINFENPSDKMLFKLAWM